MHLPGKVCGPPARRFPGFCYRVPIMRVARHIMELDPHRLTPDSEYPRDTAMDMPDLPIEDRCDYEFRLGPTGNDGMAEATLWLTPNRYTLSKKPRKVWQASVSMGGMFARKYEAEAVREVFRPHQ